MLLFILVSILTKSNLFSFALCFIVLKSVFTFEFIEAQLNKLFFQNVLCLKVIFSDYAKSLAKLIATQEIQK